ncbi:unnamed protein product [Penicillium camemberti]|uniref:Str. FM013 n=1 Tax=Penicillium camemberti (strain FM 013) TaxID=1429867 RepID=A0A0G4P8W1_PENC3|nr:unnamed protein product [Penicillium camemberti]
MKIPTAASGTCETSYWTALEPLCRPQVNLGMSNWLLGSGIFPWVSISVVFQIETSFQIEHF